MTMRPPILRAILLSAGLLLPVAARGQIYLPGGNTARFDTAVVNVQGQGEAFARPDRAVLFAEIVSEEGMAEAAAVSNGERRARVARALGELGYDPDDVSLWGYGTGPGGNPFGPPQARGADEEYEARSGLRVVVEDLDRLDLVASALLVAGATALMVELQSDQLDTARREAAEMAVRAARAEAEAVAAAAGGRLGELLAITSAPGVSVMQSGLWAYPSGPRDAGVAITPNDLLVRAAVQATWVFVEGSAPT